MDYYVGQRAEVQKTIAEADIRNFAEVSGDFNPLHMDEKEAEKSIFGKRIAHGFLGGSLISTVIGTKMPGPGTVYISQTMEFKAPVYIGDTLRAEVAIVEIINRKRARLRTQVFNQNEVCVICGEAVVRLPG